VNEHANALRKISNSSMIQIDGGYTLSGETSTDTSKNSTLQLMAASILLRDGILTLKHVPDITDVTVMKNILEGLGMKCCFTDNGIKMGGYLKNTLIPQDLASSIRASIVLLGSLLTTYGEVILPLPGGDKIGSRPVDIHIDCLKEFGIDFSMDGGVIHGRARKLPLEGTDIFMRFPSVLATGNLMMAATLAHGVTTIQNAACEPEVVDLAIMLNSMGAKIKGAGTKVLTIKGVESLHGIEYEPIPDRIETGTLLTALVMTGGKGIIHNCIPDHNIALISLLKNCGVKIRYSNDGIIEIIDSTLHAPIHAIAMPYPGLPTDLQPLVTSIATQCPGVSTIVDTIYPERFHHVSELEKLGAVISRSGNQAFVTGKTELKGAQIEGTDIRCVTSLLCAALASEGISTLQGIEHLYRGHGTLIDKLNKLGGKINI